MGDLAAVYDDTRQRLSNFVSGLEDAELARTVPACPAWSVKEVIAHHTGVAEAFVTAKFPRNFLDSWFDSDAGAKLDEWTAGQVSSRADMDLKEILDEWSEYSRVITAMARGERPWPDGAPPFSDRIVITDAGAHEQDIYGALGVVTERESPAVKIGVSSYIGGLHLKFQTLQAPALGFESGDRQWVAGEGDPIATVRAPRFELFRALSGRRAPEQVRALDWDGDPDPFVRYFYPYSPRTDALVE